MKYETPKFELVNFDDTDIIRTSPAEEKDDTVDDIW